MPFGNVVSTVSDWVTGRDRNKEGRAKDREAQKEVNRQVEANYAFDLETYAADVFNFQKERQFSYETAVTNWEYGKKIQDFTYANDLAKYAKSQEIYGAQIGFNQAANTLAREDLKASMQDLALQQAFQREAMHSDLMGEIKKGGIQKLEQGAKLYGIKSDRRIGSQTIQQNLNEFTTKNTFEKEAKFVEGLQKTGKAALGQAGVSRKKTLQSTAAESFRSLVALDASLSGARNKAGVDLLKILVDSSLAETQVGLNLDMIELGIDRAKEEVEYNNRILDANMKSATLQMERNIQQIGLQQMGRDLEAYANLNIFPEKFDYAPEPQMRPDRTFVKPVKRQAPRVPKSERVATGLDSVLGVADDVADIVLTVMGGIGTAKDIFGGKNNVLGNLTSDTFGSAASPGIFDPTGSYDWSSNTSNVFGNMSGNTLGGSNSIG
jgi:hypothetical protein